MRLLPISFLVLATGCKKPPEAPATLDDLCGYLYAHHADEDPEALEVGVANLDAWLDQNLEATKDGYTITNLSQETVDAIGDGRTHDLEDLVGAAVGTDGPYAPAEIANTLILVQPTDLSPGMYESYDRTYLPEGEEGEQLAQCFVDQDCEAMEVDNAMTSTYAGFLTMSTTTHGEYRWVETEDGKAMIQRTWITAPVVLDPALAEVDDQFFINIVIPQADGAVRLTATWIVARIVGADIPESWALNMVIDEMQSIYADVDAWLAGGSE